MSPSNGFHNGGGGGSGGGGGNGVSYIEHQVSKLDTLAGVAIKYGVEVNYYLFFFPCFLFWIFILFIFLFLTLNWFRNGEVGCFLYFSVLGFIGFSFVLFRGG